VFSQRTNHVSIRRLAPAASLLIAALAIVGCTSYAPHSSSSGPVISLSTTSFNFNSVVIGQSATQTLHIANTGTVPLTLNSVSLKSSQFSLTGPSAPRTVLPAQKVDYTISFVPTTAGNATASVQITSNASNTPASVSLAGVAEKAFAAVQVTPSSISFGNLQLKSTSTQNVTLKNTGDINITISGITVAGAGFGYSSLSPGYSLTPNQSVTFQIWFRPQTSGAASGQVSILSSNLATPASVSVSGDGVTSNPGPPNPGSPPPAQHSVVLSWGPSASSVVGYRVYRDEGSGYSPLSAILPELTYTDATVASGSTYRYVVTAVDSSGDESPYSNEATAVIPAS
jgi:HYDIN/CFA65/VesB family protein/centrosomal CEP192-like protein